MTSATSQSGFHRAQIVPQRNNGMLGSIRPSASKEMTLVTAPEKTGRDGRTKTDIIPFKDLARLSRRIRPKLGNKR
jgi:hypothetical protein